MLEAPCALADIQRNRVAAEFIHRNFHRSASAKRRVKEDKRDALSVKRALAIVASLDLLGQVDQRSQVIGREVGRAEKVSPFQIHKFRVWFIEDRKTPHYPRAILLNSSRNKSISGFRSVRGGRSLKILGSSDSPVIIFFSNSAR